MKVFGNLSEIERTFDLYFMGFAFQGLYVVAKHDLSSEGRTHIASVQK
jgi:hypothetical protein